MAIRRCLAGVLVLILGTAAAAGEKGDDISRSSAIRAGIVSAAAAAALRHLADARSRIHRQEPDTVDRQLLQVHVMLDVIRSARPSGTARDYLSVARRHLEFQEPKDVLGDLPPIYQAVNSLAPETSVSDAIKALDQARDRLTQGNKGGAFDAFNALDAALTDNRVDLPIKSAEDRLTTAQNQLKAGKDTAADESLAGAEKNLLLVALGAARPVATGPGGKHGESGLRGSAADRDSRTP